MAGPGRAGVDPAARRRHRPAHRLDERDHVAFAASREAGAVARAFEAAARAGELISWSPAGTRSFGTGSFVNPTRESPSPKIIAEFDADQGPDQSQRRQFCKSARRRAMLAKEPFRALQRSPTNPRRPCSLKESDPISNQSSLKGEANGKKPMVPFPRERSLFRRQRDTDPLMSFRRDIDRLFNDFFTGFALPSLAGSLGGEPARLTLQIDVSETDKEIRIAAELPGLDEGDVEVMWPKRGHRRRVQGRRREKAPHLLT